VENAIYPALPHESSQKGSGVFFGQQTLQKWPLIGPKKIPDPILRQSLYYLPTSILTVVSALSASVDPNR
jgi:hypothetical protein